MIDAVGCQRQPSARVAATRESAFLRGDVQGPHSLIWHSLPLTLALSSYTPHSTDSIHSMEELTSCLGCHWSLAQSLAHFDDSAALSLALGEEAPDARQQHARTHCAEAEEMCCEADDCSEDDCSSVCDGVVDCDAATVCSASPCDEPFCASPGPACFDEHCFGAGPGSSNISTSSRNCESAGAGLESLLLGFDAAASFCWEENAAAATAATAVLRSPSSTATAVRTPDLSTEPFMLSHQFVGDFDVSYYASPRHSLETGVGVSPTDLLHSMGLCTATAAAPPPSSYAQDYSYDWSNCSKNSLPSTLGSGFESLPCDRALHSTRQRRLQASHSLLTPRGARRSRQQQRYTHAQAYPYSPVSRQSPSRQSPSSGSSEAKAAAGNRRDSTASAPGRSCSVSSPGLASSPLSLAQPQVGSSGGGGHHQRHQCRWAYTVKGVKAICGATFADAAALQDHLVTEHTAPENGLGGRGFYCLWDGCMRPAEPFLQKSKLHGHFLTHSNRKWKWQRGGERKRLCFCWSDTQKQTRTSNAPSAGRNLPDRRLWIATSAATVEKSRSSVASAASRSPTAAN